MKLSCKYKKNWYWREKWQNKKCEINPWAAWKMNNFSTSQHVHEHFTFNTGKINQWIQPKKYCQTTHHTCSIVIDTKMGCWIFPELQLTDWSKLFDVESNIYWHWMFYSPSKIDGDFCFISSISRPRPWNQMQLK